LNKPEISVCKPVEYRNNNNNNNKLANLPCEKAPRNSIEIP